MAGLLSVANALYGFFILPESLPRERRTGRMHWNLASPLGALALLRSRPLLLGLAAAVFLYYLAHESLPSLWVLYTTYRYQFSERRTGLSLWALAALTVRTVVGSGRVALAVAVVLLALGTAVVLAHERRLRRRAGRPLVPEPPVATSVVLLTAGCLVVAALALVGVVVRG